MDRDGRGKPPSDESGSFDLSKMSEAEVAAELAARMARWRDARRGPKVPTRPPAGARAASPAPHSPAAHSPATQLPPADRAPDHPIVPRELDPAMAARIDSALRLATPPRPLRPGGGRARPARASSYGMAFETLLAEGLNTHAIGMGAERPVDRMLLRTRARYLPARDRGGRGRVLMPALALHAEQALRRLRLATANARAGIGAAWHALMPALDRRADAVLRRARAWRDEGAKAGTEAWRALASAFAARTGEALEHTRTVGTAAQRLAVTAWRDSKPRLARLIPRIEDAARALGVTARRAAADKLVMASAVAIAVAIVGWLLTLPEAAAPPEAAPSPPIEQPPARIDARATAAAPEPPAPPPPPAPEPPPPETASAPMPAMLKPVTPAPELAARLKPGTLPAATPATDAEGDAPPIGQSEQTTDAPARSTDSRATDDMLNRMSSDGLGRNLSRR